ncbi:MAG: hypothetical protein IT463_12565 [Planctomycetes bacterium]|nr:hypothetical protein [Planctomycetota bacterium]
MATTRELQGKAKKLLAQWKKDGQDLLKNDRRSPASHLCMSILLRGNTQQNARALDKALRERFVDWNEIRVSPIAEVAEVLQEAGAPSAEAKAYALRRFLRDLFGKYTKTSLYYDLLEIPAVVPVPVPGEVPADGSAPVVAAAGDEDEEDEAVSRESGLPPHPEVPGYVDMDRILAQPIPLDPKLITEKNGAHVASIAWDDAERGPFNALWRVALVSGLVEPQVPAAEALQKLRGIAPEKERDQFAFYGLLYAEENWPQVSKQSDAMLAKYAPKDTEEAEAEAERAAQNNGKKKATAKA